MNHYEVCILTIYLTYTFIIYYSIAIESNYALDCVNDVDGVDYQKRQLKKVHDLYMIMSNTCTYVFSYSLIFRITATTEVKSFKDDL